MNLKRHLILGFTLAFSAPQIFAEVEESLETSIETSIEASVEKAVEEHEVVEHSSPTQRLYVEADERTYRSTRDVSREVAREGEYCVFHEEHDHIHCFDKPGFDKPGFDKPGFDEPTRTVYVERETVYRTTRPSRRYHSSYDPITTGLGVGLAIGLPILIHNSIDHHHRRHYRHNYRHNYRHKYGHKYDRHRYDRYGHNHRKHRYDSRYGSRTSYWRRGGHY